MSKIIAHLEREDVEKLYHRIELEKVVTPAGCWELLKWKDIKGYYTIKYGFRNSNKTKGG